MSDKYIKPLYDEICKFLDGEYKIILESNRNLNEEWIEYDSVKWEMEENIENINEAKSSKEHNNANILAFSSSHTKEEIINMFKEFLNSKFNEDPRYIRRINMVEKYEESYEY